MLKELEANVKFSPRKAAPKKIAPKRPEAVKQAKMAKQHTKALTEATEKLIASRIGHLEMIKGSRKEVEAEKKKKEEKQKKQA